MRGFIVFGLLLILLFGCIGGEPVAEVPEENETEEPVVLLPSFDIISPDSDEAITTTEELGTVDVILNTQNIVLRQSGTKKIGEGHFIFTVDGTDTFSVYTKVFTLENLAQGEHLVKVELVHNDGTAYAPSITRSVRFYVEREIVEYIPVEHTVYINDFSFEPADINVNIGDTVIWVNRGQYPRSALCAGIFDSGVVSSGKSASVIMNTAGECDYISYNYPAMKAHITINEVD